MNPRNGETDPEVKVVIVAGMKLRFIEIDPEIVAELPDWSEAEIERESELTLKDLSISREPHESYLHAWVRAMLSENGCEDNADNRKRLIEAIQLVSGAMRFVWVMGGEEREQFRLDDSPAFQEYRARNTADRALMAAFARAADSFYLGCASTPELERFSEVVVWVWMVLWAVLPLTGIVIVWWRGDSWIPRILVTAVFGAVSTYSLISLAKEFPWSRRREEPGLNRTFLPETDRERNMSEARLLQATNLLLFLILAMLLWDSFLKPQPKAAGRFQPLGEDHYRAFDTKTGKLCTTVDILSSHYSRFKDVQAAGVEGSGTFAVPEGWDEKHIQSYLDTYRAEDPEGFLRSGRKQFDPLFDRSAMPLPTCASLE